MQSHASAPASAATNVTGMFMKAFAWPRPPILIAIVLAGPLEKYLSISIQSRGASLLWQPAFIGILIFVAIAVWFALRVQKDTEAYSEATAKEDHNE